MDRYWNVTDGFMVALGQKLHGTAARAADYQAKQKDVKKRFMIVVID